MTKKCLTRSHKTPANHLNRNPTIRSHLLGQELRRHLREEETDQENGLSGVVIVCVHAQVRQHVVRQRLNDIASIQLEGKEGDACKCADSKVDLFFMSDLNI